MFSSIVVCLHSFRPPLDMEPHPALHRIRHFNSLSNHRPLLSKIPTPSMVTPLPFLGGGPNPIFSFSLISSSRLMSCMYLIRSIRAFSFNSPKGSNLSDDGSLNGFSVQLPLSVNVVDLGLPLNTSYALFRLGSANGFGVGCGAPMGCVARRERLLSVDTVSGRSYAPAANIDSVRVLLLKWEAELELEGIWTVSGAWRPPVLDGSKEGGLCRRLARVRRRRRLSMMIIPTTRAIAPMTLQVISAASAPMLIERALC